MEQHNKKQYVPLIIALIIWALSAVLVNIFASAWELPVQSVFVFALILLLVELSFRPIQATARYTKSLAITGIVLSILYAPLNYTFVSFALTYGESTSILDFLILASPFILAGYSIMQHKLWQRSQEPVERTKIRYIAWVFLALSIGLLLFVVSISATNSVVNSTSTTSGVAQRPTSESIDTDPVQNTIEQQPTTQNPAQTEPTVERTVYTNLLANEAGTTSMTIPRGITFTFDQKQGFAIATGADLATNDDAKIIYKNLGSIGGPSITNVTVSFINSTMSTAFYSGSNYQYMGTIQTGNIQAQKYLSKQKAEDSGGYNQTDSETYLYEVIGKDSQVVISYTIFEGDETQVSRIEEMVRSVNIPL